MVSRSTRTVCLDHRELTVSNAHANCNTITVHSKWRAPRKTNTKAWKLIEQGILLWDVRAVAAAARKHGVHGLYRPWQLDGTQTCNYGHRLVQPNIVKLNDFVRCAACRHASMIHAQQNGQDYRTQCGMKHRRNFKDIADDFYNKIMECTQL